LERRDRLIDTILARIERMRNGITDLIAQEAPQAAEVRGHLPLYERSLQFVERHRAELHMALQ
jgi:hypothetical protein